MVAVQARYGCFAFIVLFCAALVLAGTIEAADAATEKGPPSPYSQVELEGQLIIIHQDFPHFDRYLYLLDTPQGQLSLHFVKDPPTHLLSGAHIRIKGAQQPDGSLLLDSGGGNSVTQTNTSSSSSTPLPNTFGAQSTLVMLVNFQDDPTNQPYTAADAQSVIFGTASNYIKENSYQQTWLAGSVVGWYTIPVSSTTCDTATIASYAQSAAAAGGANLSAFNHYVYAFPKNLNCGWAGSSFIGGSPSQSWLNGTDGSGALDIHVVVHEMGHALGLYHSHLLDCGTSATIGSNCTVNEYGDILDVMGAPQGPAPHYNAFQKERLGWLGYSGSPSIITVQTSGTYTINTYELGGSGPNALKILKSIDPATGTKTWYYVEARQPVGFDSFIANESSQNETGGVLVHIGTDGNGNTGDLLDMTPATPTYYWWFDPSLTVGRSFSDSTAGVTLTTAWVTSTGAAVTVQLAAAMTVATNQPSYKPGQTVAITATASSGGSPAGGSVSLTVKKANGAVVYTLKLKNTDPPGTYQVSATATINGAATSAATSFMVL